MFAFFFISSFKDMVNMHWTGIAWPAMFCLAYLYITQLKTKRKFITVLLTVNLVLIIVLRINFMCNAFPLSNFNDRNPEVMTKMLQEKAKDYPLVFKDMYNEPSYYMFYGHQKAYAFNTIWYKKTQFNNLPELERDFQNKAVGLVTRDSVNASSEKVPVPKGKDYYITVIPNFTSYNTTIKVKAEKFADMKASSESKVKVSVESLLTDSARALFKAKGGYILLSLTNKKTNEVFYSKYNGQSDLTNKGVFDFTFTAPAQKGEYRAVFSALTGDSFLIGFNSNTYNCKVE
ncbi:MAG: hypothetical protein EOP54_27290 [Sphingobacteriales bacterium]|nr:MAG: hypothetical protein EOP54_27290 [Sphingobacteriales bacterium]